MRAALVASSLSLLFATPLTARAQTPIPADIPAAAQSDYKQGRDFESSQEFGSALDSYQKAARHCAPSLACGEAVVRVQMMLEQFKDAAATAARLGASAPDAHARAAAALLQAQALFRQSFAYAEGEALYDKSPKHAQESLRQAEAVAARGATDDPANEPLRMLHARILAALHQDSDASREFKACASVPGTSPQECERALRLASDVDSGRNEPVPDFQLKTFDGKTVSRDSLAGKVVLIDFWASWCPPCRNDSAYIQSLLDSFPDGRFVLLQVACDRKRDDLMSYLDGHPLKGIEGYDDERVLQNTFHISMYPTYILFDRNGTVRLRVKGRRGDLRSEIRRILAEQPPSPVTAANPAPGKAGQ